MPPPAAARSRSETAPVARSRNSGAAQSHPTVSCIAEFSDARRPSVSARRGHYCNCADENRPQHRVAGIARPGRVHLHHSSISSPGTRRLATLQVQDPVRRLPCGQDVSVIHRICPEINLHLMFQFGAPRNRHRECDFAAFLLSRAAAPYQRVLRFAARMRPSRLMTGTPK